VEIIIAVVERAPAEGVAAKIGWSFSEHYRQRAYRTARPNARA
jgi:hypothetical protein